MRSEKTCALLEKIFWIFLFVNPFLDILNGIYIRFVRDVQILDVEFVSTLGITPTLVLRMLMLLVFAFYVILKRDTRSLLTAAAIGAAWVLSLLSEMRAFGQISLFTDLQYIARFCYNIAAVMAYTHLFCRRKQTEGEKLTDGLDRLVTVTLIILSFSILLSDILGVGYNTYADRLGYRGSRGFFYAGNDITAIFALLLPLALAGAMKHCGREETRGAQILRVTAVAFTANSLLLIGSKTAFIAVVIALGLALILAVVELLRGHDRKPLIAWFQCFAGTAVIFALLMLITGSSLWNDISDSFSATGEIVDQEGVGMALLSGRQYKFREQFSLYRNGGLFIWLFGIGRGSQEYIMEMDVFEVLVYYGLFGFAAMLWLYVKLAVDFFRGLFRRYDLTAVCLAGALAMTTGYLIMAGHILFSVTSGFYYAFVILYSRTYFAERPEDILLWRKDRALFARKEEANHV